MTAIPYRCIVADPPWPFVDKLRMADGVARGTADIYQSTMTIEAIYALYEPSRVNGIGAKTYGRIAGFDIDDTALLFLWITNAHLIDGFGGSVCHAWGFEPKQLITWTKGRLDVYREATIGDMVDIRARTILNIGLGHYTRNVTEHLILATRGKAKALITQHTRPNWFLARRGEHSTKPQEAYDLIESICQGPRLELFAREPRRGWTTWGDELETSPPPAPVVAEAIEWP